MRSPAAPTQRRNVVYFLPNLFTTANLFCGFYSIVASLQDSFLKAASAIIVAGIFDILDGRVARFTKVHSKFGEEYDSLADLVSFGIAPAILIYLWSLESFGRIGWLASFAFVACGALRLARFNTKAAISEKRYFEGLPVPVAAYALVFTVLLFYEMMLDENRNIFNLLLPVVLAVLMVSNIKYRSFKDMDLKDRRSVGLLVFIVFLIMIIAINPAITMFVVMIGYIASGPIFHFFREKKIKNNARKSEEKPDLHLVTKKEEIHHEK